jgi:hypothetical protein
MAKTRRVPAKPPARELQALARQYERCLSDKGRNEDERLQLASRLYELALRTEHAELHVDTHTFGSRKMRRQTYKLSDPRAALLLMERFCNVWLPVGQIFCVKKFGCKPTLPPPKGYWLGCVLIGCFVDVCPAPGAPNVMCVYLCL